MRNDYKSPAYFHAQDVGCLHAIDEQADVEMDDIYMANETYFFIDKGAHRTDEEKEVLGLCVLSLSCTNCYEIRLKKTWLNIHLQFICALPYVFSRSAYSSVAWHRIHICI